MSWAILAHDMNLFIYCLFSVIKLDLVNCVTQEAGDELSRGNCEAPPAHHALTPRCDRFIWMESSEQTDSSNDPINGFSQYVKSLETLFTTHTYFIIIVK